MSWLQSPKKSWYHHSCEYILKTGPIPRHVAFIMDGNRRFASKNSMERLQGHVMGFDILAETLQSCLDIGITEVTVYAFSIENFKRSKEEVDGLMELVRQKFSRIKDDREEFDKKGVCIRVLGNLTLLPDDIQRIIAEAVYTTRHNTKATLNVCFAYTSRDEIATAMREIAEGVQLGIIRESDITDDMLSGCLYTNESRDPDLLVRTSGEVRLSDYLLWQSGYSVLSFVPVLWPEFSIWHLYAAVLHYQRHHQAVKTAYQQNKERIAKLQLQSDYACALEELNRNSHSSNGQLQKSDITDRRVRYTADRLQRTETFLEHVKQKRLDYFESLYQPKQAVS